MTVDSGAGPLPPAQFTRDNRLLRHADFQRVYKQGRRHFATLMTVFYVRPNELQVPAILRVGFTVGRVLGGAVDRNRLKRRLREAVRKQFPAGQVACDVVINPKKALLKAEFADILKEVGTAFRIIQKAADRDRASEEAEIGERLKSRRL